MLYLYSGNYIVVSKLTTHFVYIFKLCFLQQTALKTKIQTCFSKKLYLNKKHTRVFLQNMVLVVKHTRVFEKNRIFSILSFVFKQPTHFLGKNTFFI